MCAYPHILDLLTPSSGLLLYLINAAYVLLTWALIN